MCIRDRDIDGFICPGHVSVITGSEVYESLAEKYQKPFVVAGFEGEHLLAVIYDLVRQIVNKRHNVKNLYQNAVKTQGNPKALAITEKYFRPGSATWRGLGQIPDSGMYLQAEYQEYDAGSHGLDQDLELPKSCRCTEVIVGRINPVEMCIRDSINTGNPKHADVFLVTGGINEQNKNVVKQIYEQMPDPKVVVAIGICACTGGIFQECYNILGGVDTVIPVDVYVPGCAARPEAIIDGIVQGLGVLAEKSANLGKGAPAVAAPAKEEDSVAEADAAQPE